MNSKTILASCFTTLLLTACGGGSGDDGNNAAVEADTDDIKIAAVRALGGAFDGNTSAVATVANRNNEVIVGTLGDVTVGGTDSLPEDINADFEIQQSTQSLISASLATTNSANSTTERNGNTIIIDPDEVELCADEMLFGDLTESDRIDCASVMQDMSVELLATGEEAGVITYQFQNQDMLRLGYGNNTEFSEINLAGWLLFLEAVALTESGGGAVGLPSVMEGVFRVSATSTNSTEGSEAGSISLDISEQINFSVTNDEGTTDITLDEGNIFSVEANAATGAGSISFDAGALSLIAPTDSGIASMNLGGFTGEADINPENGELVVSNFGLSRGPLSVSINNTEALLVTLNTFGFRATEGSDLQPGEVIIDGDLDLSIVTNQFEGDMIEGQVSSAMLNLLIPGGTSIFRAGNGDTGIGGVGPVSIGFTTTDGVRVIESESVTVNSGECFGSLFGSGSSSSSTTLAFNENGEAFVVSETFEETSDAGVFEEGARACE